MNYIVFDLEWNNAYNYAINGFMNEIIEIGAVKLDEQLRIVDTFKQLVKPKFTKKLSSRCKNLTNITNEEINENGISFVQAMQDFSRWSFGNHNIFLSWSNSDLYVLTNNFRVITGSCDVPFMKNYCDAQKYCMSFINNETHNQISLQKCGDIFGIEVDISKLHRALADCYLTVECLKKVFDKEKLDKYVNKCDRDFFERLLYKPHLITECVTKDYNVYKQKIFCPKCKSKMVRLRGFDCINKTFRCPTKCENCKKIYWTTIRAKKTYDGVDVSIRSIEMNKKRARRIK